MCCRQALILLRSQDVRCTSAPNLRCAHSPFKTFLGPPYWLVSTSHSSTFAPTAFCLNVVIKFGFVMLPVCNVVRSVFRDVVLGLMAGRFVLHGRLRGWRARILVVFFLLHFHRLVQCWLSRGTSVVEQSDFNFFLLWHLAWTKSLLCFLKINKGCRKSSVRQTMDFWGAAKRVFCMKRLGA